MGPDNIPLDCLAEYQLNHPKFSPKNHPRYFMRIIVAQIFVKLKSRGQYNNV